MQHITSEEIHLTNTAVALGKFEGIHLGHQLLIDEIVRLKKFHYRSVVFTFDRLPARLFSKENAADQIYTREERKSILERKGVDVLIEHPFTREFANMTPEMFVRRILVGKVGARKIIVGTDFHFGRNRSGDVDTLRYLAEDCDYDLIVIDKLQKDGRDVSSTRVKEALETADMEEAKSLLGRPYTIAGEVIHGKELGRTIHVPSANIPLDPEKFLPPRGVYITTADIDGEKVWGVTNIGIRPTVDQSMIPNVETYFLDFEGDLYGKQLELAFHHHLRPEKKFDSLEDLKGQLDKDIELAGNYKEKHLK